MVIEMKSEKRKKAETHSRADRDCGTTRGEVWLFREKEQRTLSQDRDQRQERRDTVFTGGMLNAKRNIG